MKKIKIIRMSLHDKETGKEVASLDGDDPCFSGKSYLIKHTDNEVANEAAIKSISRQN